MPGGLLPEGLISEGAYNRKALYLRGAYKSKGLYPRGIITGIEKGLRNKL